jgi:putative holliday junction resolvase
MNKDLFMPKQSTKTKYYLGIDYGESKVGLAIADGETRIAFAYGMIKNNEEMLQNIFDIIKKEKIEAVVIGVPKRMGDKKVVFLGEKLGEKLEKKNVKVFYQDEIYSTKIARENLKEKGLRDINRFDDAESARIILDSFLQKKAL